MSHFHTFPNLKVAKVRRWTLKMTTTGTLALQLWELEKIRWFHAGLTPEKIEIN